MLPLTEAQRDLAARHYHLAARQARIDGSKFPLLRIDIESDYMMRLCYAARHFDPSRGVSFRHYLTVNLKMEKLDIFIRLIGRSEVRKKQARTEFLRYGEFIPDHRPQPIREMENAEEELVRFEQRIKWLSSQCRNVLKSIYVENMTLRSTGLQVGISESRACQVHLGALRELRDSLSDQMAI